VEAAIVTPLVLALLFGIIELGFLFKDYLAAAGAVRAGVRMASATPRNATFAQNAANQVALTGGAMNFSDVQQLWVYKAGTATDKPVGFSDFSGCTTCVKFRWDAGTSKFVTLTDNWAASSQSACSTLTEHPDRIGVYVELRHNAFTGLVFNTVTISEASIMSLEPISFLTACKP
jgi:Flp pilus assembly protein TadG